MEVLHLPIYENCFSFLKGAWEMCVLNMFLTVFVTSICFCVVPPERQSLLCEKYLSFESIW